MFAFQYQALVMSTHNYAQVMQRLTLDKERKGVYL